MTYYFFNNLPDSYNSVVNALSNQPKYNLGNIFDISKASFWNNLSLFFICLIPGFNSAVFQRISMANSIDQAKRSFVISAQICFVILLILIWLVLVIQAKAPITSLIIGTIALLLSLKDTTVFKLIIFTIGFYMPIVTVPFIMAIFGYRTPYEQAVLCGMGAGLAVVVLWNYLDITVIDNVVPAMAANSKF